MESRDTTEDPQAQMRRRVQHKLAGHFLKAMDPDAVPEGGLPTPGDEGSTLSQHMDEKTRAEFEKQFGKYKPKKSSFAVGNLLWFVAALATFYLSDFVQVIRFDYRINRLWFNVGAVLLCLHLLVALFLIVWLTFIKKVSSDLWEKKYPAAIPVATATIVFGSFCLAVGLWPVWGFLTPVILFTMFMGIIVSVAFVG